MTRILSAFRSLTGRIVLVTITVAVIAVVIMALVSVQLIQATLDNEARAQLRSEAQALSTQPLEAARTLARDTHALNPRGGRFLLVGPDASNDSTAARLIGTAELSRLLAGKDVSLIRDSGRESVVVEAVPRPDGGAVLGVRAISDIRAVGGGFLPWTFLGLAAGLVAGILAGVLLARRIARPLIRTAATARRMAAGQRGVPVESHTITEIDDVSRALTGLDAALAASEARQREFLMAVSHEIRTPLTAIRGYAEALAEGVVGADETVTVGDTLVAEAGRLDHFVADLLELARLEADDFRITSTEIDLNDVVAAVAGAWHAGYRQAGVELRVQWWGSTPSTDAAMVAGAPSAPGAPGASGVSGASGAPEVSVAALTVHTDAMRVRQIIDGLVENALRVTPAGGVVVLAASAVDGVARIEVRDSGPGLSPAERAVAFQRGVLNDRYRGVRPVGTGLGLSIAARLVAALGGTIRLGPAQEGGECFRVELPLTPSPTLVPLP